ncbi:DUF1524 domain-containing protein [Streptococcus sp. IsoGale022]|uniref:GmrSD restriction endonuclease domain-containing protein n=1 Tax=Streptococcus sp. IsoGale022 TaxID=2923524 RepID=UPI00280C7EC9|nr:DUF1524 domain-containing protein [Streptococcus sp. IsoGale022]MDQ8692538.1 DUF1524 domain-containing protein [Streptococcus sp. IsoGale022]
MEQLLKKLELVYGKKIKDYFLEKTECYNFNKTDKEIVQTFVSYELGYYNEQIGEIILLRKNHYKNNHAIFTRFLLISIEKYHNQLNDFDFTELDKKGNAIWHLEHIIPQSVFPYNKNLKHDLGNLTLLYQAPNNAVNNCMFEKKREILAYYPDFDLYINKVFKCDKFDDKDIVLRRKRLINNIKEIFFENIDNYFKVILKLDIDKGDI